MILPPVKKLIQANTLLITSELVEENVTYDDEGEYTCRVKSSIDEKETREYVHVYGKTIESFIN